MVMNHFCNRDYYGEWGIRSENVNMGLCQRQNISLLCNYHHLMHFLNNTLFQVIFNNGLRGLWCLIPNC